MALGVVRAAVNEASVVFERVLNDEASGDFRVPEQRVQALVEGFGANLAFLGDDAFTHFADVTLEVEGAASHGASIRQWRGDFRRRPSGFRAKYRSRYALRGYELGGMGVELEPVEIACVFSEQVRSGAVGGTVSFKGICRAGGRSGRRPVVRRYELRRRFVLPARRSEPVSFLPAPLGIYVDYGVERRDK